MQIVVLMMDTFCRSELMYAKMYTRCIYTKCIPDFEKLLYTFCIQNLVAMVLLVLYTKCIQMVCPNVGYILYTSCLHFVYISCIHLVQFLYAKCIHHFCVGVV